MNSISRVTRSRTRARHSYDRLSRFYDLLTGGFEQEIKEAALRRLEIRQGETVLEIGPGTGHCLAQMAEAVGEIGRALGADLSLGMLAAIQRRFNLAGLRGREELTCADAMCLPYSGATFDAVLMSFTLELFDTPEIPRVLAEIERVLKPRGRLGIVGMSNEGGTAPIKRFYEWLHERFPLVIDCRPIYVVRSLQEARYEIEGFERVSLFGLPVEIVVAKTS